MSDLTSVFDRVYETGRWTSAGNGLGPGSDPGATAPLVRGLGHAIRRFGIRSIVDVSCGGMAWWPAVLDGAGPVAFHGFDVSRVTVARNRARYASRDWRFGVADARSDGFPEADLIVCRQTLNHLWPEDAVHVVENLLPRARIVALTHDPALPENPGPKERRSLFPDCGRATVYARLNLLKPPFPLLEGLARIGDVEEQVLGLFRGEGPITAA